MIKRLSVFGFALCLLVGAHAPALAFPVTFGPGSLIIPMDIAPNGQDHGMLRAYGLVYNLLRSDVPVHWVIQPGKPPNGDDFTIAAGSLQDVRSGGVIGARSYRGGPFVIAQSDAAAAMPVIQAWQAAIGDQTAVHKLVAGTFTPNVDRLLVSAPRIAVLKDGNELIAFNSLNAAGIRDSVGGLWSASSPDQLTEADVSGPTTTNHADGALFHLPGGLPRHCYLAAMHYNPTNLTPEVVAEVGSWLDHGPQTHALMQCEAAKVFENDAAGRFLTSNGITDDGSAPMNPAIRVPSHPLTQMDGQFEVDDGTLDSIGLGAGSSFQTGVATLINEGAGSLTQRIVLLTGRMDGDVSSNNGKVTYFAGHDYTLDLPISGNPQTNGARVFLNSIFDADCAISPDPDEVTVTKSAPALINAASLDNNRIPYTVTYSNAGARPAENLRLTDVLPAGTSYVPGSGVPAPSSTAGGVLTWDLLPLPPGATAAVTFRVSVTSDGSYTNRATLDYSHLSVHRVASNAVSTLRDTIAPGVTITAGPNGSPGGPGAVTNSATPTFAFTVSGAPITVECRYDAGPWIACAPPAFVTPLPLALSGGNHNFQIRASDAAGNSGTASRMFIVDLSPPQASFSPANPFYFRVTQPAFSFSAIDTGGPGAAATTRCAVDAGGFVPCLSPWQVPSTLSDGSHVVRVEPTDAAGNVGPIAAFSFVVDTVPPTLNPVVTPNPVVLGGSATVTPGAADPGSGIASQSCGALVTGTAGPKTVTCTATDNAGNTRSVTVNYVVRYNFGGFSGGAAALPATNTANSGSAVPIKFTLAGATGLNIFAAGYPASGPIACDAVTVGAVVPTNNPGGSSMSVSGSGQYNYVWKTEKAWKGTCRMLVFRFNDGTERLARFRFDK